jgi:hypothetical protein
MLRIPDRSQLCDLGVQPAKLFSFGFSLPNGYDGTPLLVINELAVSLASHCRGSSG